MKKKLEFIYFDKILCEYQLKSGIILTIDSCSYLEKQLKKEGVTGYRIGDYTGKGYLTRYLEHTVERIPMLEYKDNILIPMIFRNTVATNLLAQESYRFKAFLKLLDWYLKYEPEAVLIKQHTGKGRKKIIDTAFLTFRLAEICDGAAFPISNFDSLADFTAWNNEYRLIDNGAQGKHAKKFDENNPVDLDELIMIIQIVKMRYETSYPGSY